ncbi:hypothetical protein J2I47_19735 [Fibrella sp. HMF5335]|uniref:Uncharacterized protein n=1 Tax=Fibrella rubiginis TaxID=2817060 RepID=A0A939GLX6_9BACT|nr:hypothetical protein [Fibrella rubiginis]MBO0938793.1 hypothetical protein [Fibrella rubiginis]
MNLFHYQRLLLVPIFILIAYGTYAQPITDQYAFDISPAERAIGQRMSYYGRTKNTVNYRKLALQMGAKAMTSTEGLRQAIDADFQQPINYKDQSEAGKAMAARLVAERTKHMRDSQKYAQWLHKLAAAYLLLHMTNPADLKQALTWSARSVELVASPENLDTHAQLLYRLGRKAEAIETEREAVAQALGAGVDARAYELTLDRLQK